MEPITIRAAKPEDFEAVLRLIVSDTFASRADPLGSEIPPEYRAAYLEILSSPVNGFLLAFSGETLVGVTQMLYSRHLSYHGALRLTVEAVRVREEFRDQGIGTRLMEAAIDEARSRGCNLVQLTSRKERTDAHRFYERLGFSPSHVGMKLYLK